MAAACGSNKGIELKNCKVVKEVYVTGGQPAALYVTADGNFFQVGKKRYALVNSGSFAVNPNGYAVAFRRNNKTLMRFAGVDTPVGSGIVSVALSPDGSRCGWIITNSGWFVEIGGKRYGGYDFADNLSFSADGNSFAFQFTRGGLDYVNFNGEELGGVEDIYGYTFTPDGKTCAFAYHNNWRDFLDAGVNVYGGYTKTNPPVYSQDGYRMAFVFVEGGSYYGKPFVNVDGDISGPFETVGELKFSENGTKFGFTYYWKGKYYVKVNSITNGGYDLVQGPYLAQNTAGYGYAYSLSNRWHVVVNGADKGVYDKVFDVGFVSNQTGSWFAAANGGKAAIYYGTNVIECGSEIVRAMFKPDGSGFAAIYVDAAGERVVSINGEPVDRFERVAFNWKQNEGILEVAGVRQSSLYYRQYRM